MNVLKKVVVMAVLASLLIVPNAFAAGEPEGEPLKIGVLGVMSGHAASWGLVCKYCAEANAQIFNEQGGVVIDGVRHKIEIVTVDTKQDPKIAVTGAERLVYQEGIKYIIGPNIDNTAISVAPVMEAAGAMYIPYNQSQKVFSPPHENAILGMIASFQSGPIIYKYMQENRDVNSIAFVARNQPDPLAQRNVGVEAARELGLAITSWEDTYEPGTTDFFPVMTKVVSGNPDLIVLSGVSPGDAPLLIKAARQLGFEGYLSAETSHDINILNEVAGEYANDFIFVGGASTPAIASDYMNQFKEVYTEIAGEWNDEAGTKVYALPMIIYTLQKAGAEALENVELFKEAIPKVAVKNPYLNEEKTLKYVGEQYFQQPRQIGVPMVVNIVKDGELETLFVGSVE
ncbi:ABC transporter substrate-binding protein [candidate division KSB3 bacterium]|uniref:ABC transporter substrate-binding protein n=1 Tax=candidate division KSB3 bacterium TaxID=2044937 RepID=A0A9D5JRS7_9BACT|nr:ABC transporter substrate-binding protein [candidate division KSB3 bacterium]MBD3322945.1 ABC transporter substrate-binding protein [candidate division KSB3 bacterium]